MKKYTFGSFEKKWQREWEKKGAYRVPEKAFSAKRAKNLYVLDMFPYPSGEGLHVGHVEGYTASDILSRYYRMRGYNVLHPMGWDAFGLPAENYAIKKKVSPESVVKKNVANFKRQIMSLGFSYDWSREINTTDPDYYRWTQWIFLQLYKKGLAYEKEMPVNWCPSCKTVLADEEAEGGVCERCGSAVERRNVRQWMLRITAYANRLLKDLDSLDWPQKVKLMQRNWIGKSEGALINFAIQTEHTADNNKHQASLQVFTTRPDTIFGATYLVIAPEHPVLEELKDYIANWHDVSAYAGKAKNKSEQERISEVKDKSGIEAKGIKALNPATHEQIPVFVADYVLAGYGTGAIMAVPAHDERDYDFAKKFNLPIVPVISPAEGGQEPGLPYADGGALINSGPFSGRDAEQAKDDIIKLVHGKKSVNYRLRDWIFSRQRYWGEPMPLVFCEHCRTQLLEDKARLSDAQLRRKWSEGEIINPGWIPVPEKELPLKLPKVKHYEPTGTLESPLAAMKSWVNTACPRCKGKGRRETNTMPQWAGSCWYYARFIDPHDKKELVSKKKAKAFLPVDIYIGGVEHAVLHLLYARFWHKALYDDGVFDTSEPFRRLINQGLILGTDGEKMSKSRGNVVNPDDIIREFGADALRMYEMFMGPLEDVKPWNNQGITGISRFLQRTWNLYQAMPAAPSRAKADPEFMRLFHRTIKKVTDDIESLSFNTAISAMMVLLREMEAQKALPEQAYVDFIKLLVPFAPFTAEELWHTVLKRTSFITQEPWPKFAARYLKAETCQLVVQVNGKTRGVLEMKAGSNQDEALAAIAGHAKLRTYIDGKSVRKVIFVPDKIINIVL
jgi:leucyl-tRNA synthetase